VITETGKKCLTTGSWCDAEAKPSKKGRQRQAKEEEEMLSDQGNRRIRGKKNKQQEEQHRWSGGQRHVTRAGTKRPLQSTDSRSASRSQKERH
jgi:hypothetical protein